MSLKKIKEKNPGFEFSSKVSKKASEAVKQTSLKSKLNIDSYNLKFPDQASATSRSGRDEINKDAVDKKWKFLKKTSRNQSMDSIDEPKGSFYDENGNEMAAED